MNTGIRRNLLLGLQRVHWFLQRLRNPWVCTYAWHFGDIRRVNFGYRWTPAETKLFERDCLGSHWAVLSSLVHFFLSFYYL